MFLCDTIRFFNMLAFIDFIFAAVWNVMPSEIKEEGDQSKWKRQIRSFCANMDSLELVFSDCNV
jgi:hypothetical protein